MPMKIIKENLEKTNIINKSKFIGKTIKVTSQEEITSILNEVKRKYPDATHICYAYHLLGKEKYSDDGEPEGTAGKPILEIIKKNNLDYILAIVIRYFGGIKLGSNGLIHAYGGIIKELLKDNTKEIEDAYLIEITDKYSNSDNLNYLLKNEIILQKDYQDKIKIKAIIKKETLEKLSNVSYTIIEKTII